MFTVEFTPVVDREPLHNTPKTRQCRSRQIAAQGLNVGGGFRAVKLRTVRVFYNNADARLVAASNSERPG